MLYIGIPDKGFNVVLYRYFDKVSKEIYRKSDSDGYLKIDIPNKFLNTFGTAEYNVRVFDGITNKAICLEFECKKTSTLKFAVSKCDDLELFTINEPCLPVLIDCVTEIDIPVFECVTEIELCDEIICETEIELINMRIRPKITKILIDCLNGNAKEEIIPLKVVNHIDFKDWLNSYNVGVFDVTEDLVDNKVRISQSGGTCKVSFLDNGVWVRCVTIPPKNYTLEDMVVCGVTYPLGTANQIIVDAMQACQAIV